MNLVIVEDSELVLNQLMRFLKLTNPASDACHV